MNIVDRYASNWIAEMELESNQRTDPRIHLLLDDLQSPVNIGKCARVAEIYGMDLYIHDRRNLTRNAEAVRTMSDFACGAWERRTNRVFEDVRNLAKTYRQGRLVATCLQNDAIRLHEFEFAENDLIMFGNEYDGLNAELIACANAKVYIPMPTAYLPKPHSHVPIDPARSREVSQNGIPNLNVSVAAGIVAYAFSCWLERHRHAAASECRSRHAIA